jgi:hypothetical protein
MPAWRIASDADHSTEYPSVFKLNGEENSALELADSGG